MLQLPVIVVLVVSMFVGRVSPVLQKEHEKSKVEVAPLEETTSILNSIKPVESSINTTEAKKEKIKDTNNSTTSKSSPKVGEVTPANVQKPIENKQDCNSMKEQDNMLECYATPHDNDELIEQDLPVKATEPTINTTTIASNKTEASTESQVPKVTPPPKKEESSRKDVEIVVTSTQATDQVPYDVNSAKTNHSISTTNSDVSSTNSKHNTNTSEAPAISVRPLLVDKIAASVESEDIVGAVKSADEVNTKHMPSGIIALVTAISFAIIIALVYIGMIVWRRYIEYRYGHRELLVNELEFDTNDLRHFEL